MQCPELAPLASVPIVMVINPTALLLEQREGTFWTAGKSLACYNITISPLSRETPGGRNASLCEGFCHVASLSFIQPLEKKRKAKLGLSTKSLKTPGSSSMASVKEGDGSNQNNHKYPTF